MEFTQSQNDPCIYYKNIGGEKFYIGVYVDDIILAGKTDRNLEEVKTALSTKFNIKDLGELNYFLGIKVDQKTQNSIWIGMHVLSESVSFCDLYCYPELCQIELLLAIAVLCI